MLIVILIIFSLVNLLYSDSIYYLETFDNWSSYTANGWIPDYRYGRDGVFYHGPRTYPAWSDDSPSTNDINGGRLRIYGRANNGDLNYNNYWVGRVVKFVPQNCPSIGSSLKATSANPFGFQIIRYYSLVDPNEELQGTSDYHQCDINVWLVRNEPEKTNEWDTLENFVYFMEKTVDTWANSKFGYFSGSEFLPDVTSLTCADGSTFNFATADWQIDYDDGSDGTPNSIYGTPTTQNSNRLGIRFTHDGSKIKIYLNPNPIDGDGYNETSPNAWFLLGTINVGWNTNLAVMIGHETLYYLTESQEAIYDNFLIRTVSSNVFAEIYPVKVRKNTDITFTLEIKGSFSSNDSGIGEILIKKPEGYGAWNLANVNVYTNYVLMSKIIGDSNPSSGTVAVSITNGGQSLKIRFCKTSGSTNDIIDYYNNKPIKVEFTLKTPATPDASGQDFEVYVNNEKYPDTGGDITLNAGGIKYATTGWQKAIPGDVSTNINTSSLTVKVYNDPQAFAGITVNPQPVYEDETGIHSYTYFYEVSTSGISDAPDISKLIINVPAGFNVSNVQSLLIIDDTNNIKVSNNMIIVDYYNDPAGKLPSPGGYDKITIVAYGTPDLPLNTLYTDYLWSSEVSSENIVVGSSNQFTTTNSEYPSQSIRVIIVSPELECSIDLTNGVGVPKVGNDQPDNAFVMRLLNSGINTILKCKIEIPDVFTNVYAISSSLIGTNVVYNKTSNIIYLNYTNYGTNLPPSTYDDISFHLVHNRQISDAETNVDVVGYADNGNTEGYVAGHPSSSPGWTVTITPPDPTGEGQINTNVIFTTLSSVWETNLLYYTIYNNGAKGNNIEKAKIIIPDVFEILQVSSSHISNDASYVTITNNIINLDYGSDSNGVLKSYLEISSEKDVVILKLRHKITSPTNMTVISYVKNEAKTNWAETTDYPGETRVLSVEYPPVNAECYVEVQADPINNIIDSSTTTNQLTYVIANKGRPGNRILKGYIYIPLSISTNVIDIQSSKIADDGSYAYYDPVTGIIYLNYDQDANGPLLGGETDTITFKLIDYITGEGSYEINSKVSNDRELASCAVAGGKSKTITFDIPDADAACGLCYKYIYVRENQTVESFVFKVTNRGKGSNYLKKLKIIFPAIFTGKVSQIYSSYLNQNSPQPYMSVHSTYAEILYDLAGNELVSSATDMITITFTNDFTTTNTALWDMNVDNGDGKGYVSTSVISGMTKEMKIITPPDVNITPTEVYTTASNISFSYYLHNGNSSESVPILKAKIYIPYPFSVADITSYSHSWSGSISIVSNYIFLDYTSSPLSPGGQDIVSFTFQKVNSPVSTNVDFDCYVDFGYAKEYRDTVVLSGNSKTVSVIFPPADALAYSEPNNVSKDITISPYSITIKNVGGYGNIIYQAKIIAPDFITNITDLSSTKLGTNLVYSNSKNTIYLYYYKYSTNIPPFDQDVVSFNGMDNLNIETQGNWIVEVNNTTNTNGYTQAAVYPGKSLTLNLYKPSYLAYSYVSPNQIDSTYITNNITIGVVNSSADGSRINKVKILIPPPFITNSIAVNTETNAQITVYSNYVLIDYYSAGNSLLPNESDTISLSIVDTFNTGFTQTVWTVLANYSSSGDRFITNLVLPGNSLSNYFYMPYPEYSLSMEKDEIYTTTSNFYARFFITNKGTGAHKITSVSITIPPIFTNGLTLSDISSTIGYQTNLNANTVKIDYTNFTPGTADTITLALLNTNKSVSTGTFNISVSNGYYANNTNITMNIETPPSAYLIDSLFYSTAKSNYMQIGINNDSTGDETIYNIKVILPSFITNIKYFTSAKGATYQFTNSSVIIQYPTGLPDGENDTVGFYMFDNITTNEYTNSLNIMVLTSIATSEMRPSYANALDYSFVIPPPQGYSYILSPTWVYTTEKTNKMQIVITNTGADENSIYMAVINLPAQLSLISPVTSSHIVQSSNIATNVSSITLYYDKDTNGLLETKEKDLITFHFSHNYDKATNLIFDVLIKNSKTIANAYPDTNNTLTLKIKYPEEESYYYVVKPDVIYTIDTNAQVILKVKNSSYDAKINKLYISLNPLLEPVSLSSAYSNLWSYSSNKLEITYSDGIPPRQNDQLTIGIKYNFDRTTNLLFTAQARFEGREELRDLDIPEGETNIVLLQEAFFGRIKGNVVPSGYSITVEVVDQNYNNITNFNGEYISASVNTTNGEYLLDFVPPGTYNLRFISEEFRTTYLYSVEVYSNQITLADEVRLRNKILNDQDNQTRRIMADDDISYAEFPPYSVLRDFYLDIYKKDATGSLVSSAEKNESILSVSGGFKVFEFHLENENQQTIPEIPLNSKIKIVLHYTDEEISKHGWSEDSLAIYYWKENTGEWVRLGGTVDKVNNTVTVEVTYLHNYYAIFGSSSVKYTKIFGDIKVWPNPFTPGRGGDTYQNMHISFIFKNPVDKFKFVVYDLSGREIYQKEYTGSFTQAEIYWDGKDKDGFVVKSGVYIFQIETSNEYYRGKLMILR